MPLQGISQQSLPILHSLRYKIRGSKRRIWRRGFNLEVSVSVQGERTKWPERPQPSSTFCLPTLLPNYTRLRGANYYYCGKSKDKWIVCRQICDGVTGRRPNQVWSFHPPGRIVQTSANNTLHFEILKFLSPGQRTWRGAPMQWTGQRL